MLPSGLKNRRLAGIFNSGIACNGETLVERSTGVYLTDGEDAEGFHTSLESSYPLVRLSDRFFSFAGLFGHHTLTYRCLFGNSGEASLERVLGGPWRNVTKSVRWRDNHGAF
jgi:hypothetical protein